MSSAVILLEKVEWMNTNKTKKVFCLTCCAISGPHFFGQTNQKWQCSFKVQIFWEGHKNLSLLPIWLYLVASNYKWNLGQIFVAFSEYLNFKQRYFDSKLSQNINYCLKLPHKWRKIVTGYKKTRRRKCCIFSADNGWPNVCLHQRQMWPYPLWFRMHQNTQIRKYGTPLFANFWTS